MRGKQLLGNQIFVSVMTSFDFVPLSSILEMDTAIGKILDKLDEMHVADNTLVYFTSDHGCHIDIGTKGGSNGIFPGKGTLERHIDFIKSSDGPKPKVRLGPRFRFRSNPKIDTDI